MSEWSFRPTKSGDFVLAGTTVVVNRRSRAREHLKTGIVIERGGSVAGVYRGRSLLFFHEEHGLIGEFVPTIGEAVERMKELID